MNGTRLVDVTWDEVKEDEDGVDVYALLPFTNQFVMISAFGLDDLVAVEDTQEVAGAITSGGKKISTNESLKNSPPMQIVISACKNVLQYLNDIIKSHHLESNKAKNSQS